LGSNEESLYLYPIEERNFMNLQKDKTRNVNKIFITSRKKYFSEQIVKSLLRGREGKRISFGRPQIGFSCK